MNELKDCPFCGGEASFEYTEWREETEDGDDGTGWVWCLKCGIRTGREDRSTAKEEWNTRSQEADNLRLSNLVTKFDTALRTIATEAVMVEAYSGVDTEEKVDRFVRAVKTQREALERLARLGNEPAYGNSIGNVIAQDALREKP